ncbi:MAG: DUF5684 domain-containing protein [Chloroflexales bacterium]|nr:DUF5684 domain-containing protein [Chloroflexales bacterium]
MPLFFQDASSASDGAAAVIAVVMNLIPLAIGIAMLVGMWKVFAKAGKPGWAAIIPFYNDSVLIDICGLPVIYKYYLWAGIALSWCGGIPLLAAMVVRYFALRVLLQSYGQPSEPINVIVALVFPFYMYPKLGFGTASYLGVQAAAVAAAPLLPGSPKAITPPTA